MIVIKVSNQRSYYYIKIDDLKLIGFVWQKLSEKGFYKLHGYYNWSSEVIESIKDSKTYFDSLNQFLQK